MKVKELISHLQTLDPDCEIRVGLRKGWRPVAEMQEITEIIEVIEQDSNQLTYCIDIDMKASFDND